MNPTISGDAFNAFFGWAPWVIGIAIYFVFYLTKRKECAAVPAHAPAAGAATAPPTFVCARCGRRGSLDQMVAQEHGGATSYLCSNCATGSPA